MKMSSSSPFQWLSPDLEHYCLRMLDQPMPRGRGTLGYREFPQHLSDRSVRGKHHIVFISYYPDICILKKSKVLRDHGHCYTTLIACCIREDVDIHRWVDQAYEVEDYRELLGIMGRSSPRAICVLSVPGTHFLGAVTLAARPDSFMCLDIRDLIRFLRKNGGDRDCRLEQAILGRCDSFIHKMPPYAVDEMRQQMSLEIPDYCVHSLPLRELFTEGTAGLLNGRVRIVYPGGVMPPKIALERGHGNHLIEQMIRKVAAQNLELTIYAHQNARNMFWEEHALYHALASEEPNFHFLRGVPFYELPQSICHADFGLHYENIADSEYNPKHFQYNMATKVFSFIEAGLPLLVHTGATYMHEFMIQYGLGFSYRLDQLDNLRETILAGDIQEVRNNVRLFRENHDMATSVPSLLQAVGIE